MHKLCYYYGAVWCVLWVENLRVSSRPPGGQPEAGSKGLQKRSKRVQLPDPHDISDPGSNRIATESEFHIIEGAGVDWD